MPGQRPTHRFFCLKTAGRYNKKENRDLLFLSFAFSPHITTSSLSQMLNQVLFFVSFVIVACLAAPEIIQPKVILLPFTPLFPYHSNQNTVLPRITKMGGFHIGGNTKDLEGLPLQNVTLQIGQPPRSYDPNGT